MHSFEMLTKISGDPSGRRCEELAFNSLPAALTADQKALHYLTGANMVHSTRTTTPQASRTKASCFPSVPRRYRCCQHNVSHGWPTMPRSCGWPRRQGPFASLYSASESRQRCGRHGGSITEETDYPFSDTINLRIAAPQACAFHLLARAALVSPAALRLMERP